MGLFKTKHIVTEAEREFQKENMIRLRDEFDMTKAMGVKKYPDAMQFIYDKERRCFVVVQGPEDTFKLKSPWVVDFDQVEDVYLDVEEWWTATGNRFDTVQPHHILVQSEYDKVFWRYNLLMVIKTSHPYAKTITYYMNYYNIVTRIAGLRLFVQRGLDLKGEYRGEQLAEQSARIAELAEKQKEAVGREKMTNIILNTDKQKAHNEKGMGERIFESMKEDYFNEKYIKKMVNVSKHLDRAYRISKVLGKV